MGNFVSLVQNWSKFGFEDDFFVFFSLRFLLFWVNICPFLGKEIIAQMMIL